MAVKKRAGRPKRKMIKEETKMEATNIEPNTREEIKKEFVDLFPDRTPVYGEGEYVDPDATKLTKNGKDWVPEDHGYAVRLMSPEQIKIQGMRGYTPVPVDSNIRFKDHPLFAQEISTEQMGKGIHRHPKDINEMNEELNKITGGSSKFVKLNSSILCLAPLELAQSRRKFAKEISNNGLKNSLRKADEEAQGELGNDTRRYGKFSVGRNAERSRVDGRTKSVKKIWSVPAAIK